MTEKLSDEARREAERVAASMNMLGGWFLDQRMHRRGVRLGFELGAEWQAARDQERIDAAEAEVERLRGQLDAADRQIEARTGETAGERLWKARVKQANALLARIRDTLSNAPECDKYDDDDAIKCGWKRDMQHIRTILDGDANADDS